MLIFLIILLTLGVQFFIFAGALHLFAKLFKVENVKFKTTLKIFSIYVAANLGFIFASIAGNYTFSNLYNSASNIILKIIVALFIFSLIFLIFYYFLYRLFKKYYQTQWKIFIKIFILFTIFGLAWDYFIVGYVRVYLFEPFFVKSESMEPTFLINDYLIVKKFNNKYQRGDVALFRGSAIELKDDFIKRIVALPNEHIQIKNGNILINNRVLSEGYIKKEIVGNVDIALGNDEYFILGDNIERSYDSRSFGPIKKEDILGKVTWGLRLRNLGLFFLAPLSGDSVI